MTEQEVFERILASLSPSTWGQGRFGWSDGSPKCLSGHINFAIFDSTYSDHSQLDRLRTKFKVEKRINKYAGNSGGSVIYFNDTNNYKKVRKAVESAYRELIPKEKKSNFLRRIFYKPPIVDAHEFTLKK